MFLPNARFARRAMFSIAVITAFSAPVLAQSPSRPPAVAGKPASPKRRTLDLLRYDPVRQGPLMLVAQYGWQLEYDEKDQWNAKAATGKTPAQFAEQTGRRIVTVGEITTFVPPTMKQFVKNPGKPDPYAGMRFDQRFVRLLGSLSRDQWKQAGGANGIGLGDLSEEQHPLFAGIWRGDTVKVRSTKTREKGDAFASETDSVAASEIRFRLSRHVVLSLRAVGSEVGYLYKPGSEEEHKGELQADGTFLQRSIVMPSDTPDPGNGTETVSAFGVPVIVPVPNRLKTGHLALDAPALSVAMRLDGSHTTVGALIVAAAKATRLRLIADKRIAALPVGYQVAPGGQMVSTSDVLKVLCRSVTGTFRRLDGPDGTNVYLLTDDVEGIGTRFARLDRWAEKAGEVRNELYRKAINDCAEKEPLDSLGFAPDYPHALTPEQTKVIDDGYRTQNWGSNPTIPVSQLSPALREEFQRGIESWRKWDNKATLRNDAVQLDTDFRCEWVLPGGRTLPAQFNGELDYGFLRQIAVPQSQRTTAQRGRTYKNPLPTGFPPALKRRILTAPLPDTEEEVSTLFALLVKKGFREAWLRVGDSDAATRERLEKAVSLGKTAGIRVGTIIPWLLKQDPESPSAPDINLLGETGDMLADAKMVAVTDKTRAAQQRRSYSDREAGWVVLESQDIAAVVRRVSPFTKIADLSAVAFTHTAAPGYDNARGDGDSHGIRGRMGYNASLRFRCVVEKGFDPVDVAGYSYHLGFSPEMPFFRQFDMAKPLAEFRRAQNKAHLARIHAALQGSFSQTPVYMNDSSDRNGLFAFYSRWSKPEGVADSEERYLSKPEQLRGPAFRASTTPIFALTGVHGAFMQEYFWNAWHDTTREAAAHGWDGFLLDMLGDASGDPDTLLKKLPDESPLPVK